MKVYIRPSEGSEFTDSDAKAEHKLNAIFVSGLLIHPIKVIQYLIPVLIGIADILVDYSLKLQILTVKVSAQIKEGEKTRIQVFEGTVIKVQGHGARQTFTVRKNSNGVGVEKTWPLHSPFVEKIEVVRPGKVRRAKLFYLRDRVGKAAKVKELVK